jgi:16S rRNA (guanine527-N7)-methyltransferase
MSRKRARISAKTADFSLASDRARALECVPVSRETEARLDRFVELLLAWQQRINLVAPSTLPELWTRHIADSLQLLALAPEGKIWVDLGSGGGFPGLVIACALAERDGAAVHLVESNQKKAAFLREAARITAAPAIVHAERIEEFARKFPGKADVVTARALAPLADLLREAYPLLKTGAIGLFLKGQDVERELTAASKCWTIAATLVASKTSESGRIVVIRQAAARTQPDL